MFYFVGFNSNMLTVSLLLAKSKSNAVFNHYDFEHILILKLLPSWLKLLPYKDLCSKQRIKDKHQINSSKIRVFFFFFFFFLKKKIKFNQK
jgi:hypothetical protein